MSFRRSASCLALVTAALATAPPAAMSLTHTSRWQSVTFDGVRLRVPSSWPVIRFAADPSACPRLDIHAVYLGRPGPDPRCPAGLVGRSEAVLVEPMRPSRAGVARPVTAAHQGTARILTDDVAHSGVRVSISYRADRALAATIRSS